MNFLSTKLLPVSGLYNASFGNFCKCVELNSLLEDDNKMKKLVIKELQEVKKKYAHDRVSEIVDEVEEDEKESKVVTVLNYVIIGFVLVFVGLVCIIVKEMFF